MSDPWEAELAEYESARDAYESKRREEQAAYSKATSGVKSDAAAAQARIEAEYVAKVREARSELAAVTRRVKAQLSDFRITRDALLRAEARKLDGLVAPEREARRRALAHLKAMKDEAWDRYHAKRWP